MNFSIDLQEKLAGLTAIQRRAILMIVGAEAEGLPLSRLLKNSYSCQFCGQTVGRSGDDPKGRKALLHLHAAKCERRKGPAWEFAANESTYYSDWLKQEVFVDALNEAREEVIDRALEDASRLLKVGTVDTVRELLRLSLEAEKEADRIRVGLGILDRASSMTARKGKIEVEHETKQKQNGKVVDLLNRLRGLA